MSINPKDLSKESLEINSNLKLFQIYKKLKRVSLKCDTYFQVYEELFSKYVGKKITFVEVGVLQGGSLFMWREYFGKEARIIGVDLHPNAKELEKHGFNFFLPIPDPKIVNTNDFILKNNLILIENDITVRAGYTLKSQWFQVNDELLQIGYYYQPVSAALFNKKYNDKCMNGDY